MDLLNLFNRESQTFDVSSVKYKKYIDDQLVIKLTNYFESSYRRLSKDGHHKIMVGIDGEVNCLIAAQLLKQAVGENVVAMIFDLTNPAWTENLVKFCKQLGMESFILKRGVAYQNEVATYRLHNPKSIRHFYKRFINYHLLIAADQMKAAVLDTVDKSDRFLGLRPEGFYGHFMPFYSLYKSEVYELARFLKIPTQLLGDFNYQEILYPPGAALSWDKIDPVLYLLAEKQLRPEEISQQFKIDLPWLKRLKSHMGKQAFVTAVSQFII